MLKKALNTIQYSDDFRGAVLGGTGGVKKEFLESQNILRGVEGTYKATERHLIT